jgi:hypothetical protein
MISGERWIEIRNIFDIGIWVGELECEDLEAIEKAGQDLIDEVEKLRQEVAEWQAISKEHSKTSSEATSQCLEYQQKITEKDNKIGELRSEIKELHGECIEEMVIEFASELPPLLAGRITYLEKLTGESEAAQTGAGLIVEERRRQVEKEGYTAEHDDQHKYGWLAINGAILALSHTDAYVRHPDFEHNEKIDPWGLVGKHGSNTIRALTIAGSLLAAEIDRLRRLETRDEQA